MYIASAAKSRPSSSAAAARRSAYGNNTSNIKTNTPGSHSKISRHKTVAKGWVARNSICYRYLDGCAKTFQDFPRVGSKKTGTF